MIKILVWLHRFLLSYQNYALLPPLPHSLLVEINGCFSGKALNKCRDWEASCKSSGQLQRELTVCAAKGTQRKSFVAQQRILFLFLMVGEKKINVSLSSSPGPKIWRPTVSTLKGQRRDAPRRTVLILYSVACVRGGIGSTGQIVTPWQMRSVRLWNCSQSCKTDLLSTDELEPIHRDTLKITVVQT